MFETLGVPAQSELYHWADYIELLCLADHDGQYSAARLAERAKFAADLQTTSPDAQDVTLGDVMDLILSLGEEQDLDHVQLDDQAPEDLQEDLDESEGWADFGREAELADDRFLWCQNLFRLLSEREKSLEDAYPFHVDPVALSIERLEVTDQRLLYVFYLACSSLAYVSRKTMYELTAKFEVLSGAVLKAMLPSPVEVDQYGTAGNSRFVGSPFERIEGLAEELRGQVLVEATDFHPKDTGDNGLDLVAWLPMQDNGEGVVSFFCQCACGVKWEGKQFEAAYERWKEFIALTSSPTKITFIPYYFRKLGERWYAASDVSGVVVDRLRAIRIADAEVLGQLPRELAQEAWNYRESPV